MLELEPMSGNKKSTDKVLDDVGSYDSTTSIVDFGVEDVPPLPTAILLGLQVPMLRRMQGSVIAIF